MYTWLPWKRRDGWLAVVGSAAATFTTLAHAVRKIKVRSALLINRVLPAWLVKRVMVFFSTLDYLVAPAFIPLHRTVNQKGSQ